VLQGLTKKFLTIRGNLLLINLVVIGLIFWLAVSFLHIAATQRKEAKLLQGSMDAERAISEASEALNIEGRRFNQQLHSSRNLSGRHLEKLNDATLVTDKSLEASTVRIKHLVTREGFIDKIPASEESLRDLFESLKLHRSELPEKRSFALAQAAGNQVASDIKAHMRLRSQHNLIQEKLVSLASSLNYLPSQDAASVSIYQTLMNQILIINVDLARKYLALSDVIAGTSDTSVADIRLLDEKIQQRLEHLIRLSQASNRAEELLPLASMVQRYYQENYLRTARELSRSKYSSTAASFTQEDWLIVSSELSRLINKLASSTHDSIEVLANISAERSTRNFFIDIILVALCFMITAASVLISRRMKQHAYQDGLTQLANRLNFESTLLEATTSNSQSHAVIFLDLDGFKAINDNYGHAVGDELLIEVATRLKAMCRSTDLLARLGGDEFSVLLRDIESSAAVERLASRLVNAIEEVVSIRDLNLKVGASAGVCISPEDCEGGVDLLRNADIAMYHAKTNKSENAGKVFRFNQDMAANYQERLVLEQDLKRAFENREFHMVYQPKVCTQTGKVLSVEALLRWTHPERGLVSPVVFIPVAEETGLMGRIGQWVLNESCREIAQLQKQGLNDMQVAVNISAQQFGDQHFVDRVQDALRTHDLEYSNLTLEVTESIVMNDIERVIQMLKQLQSLGIDIAVDDFGTGYSSLQYLQELPLNTLKIDRAFIIALDNHAPDCSVANSIVQMAALFSLETVAEGVETLEQERMVRSLGVHHIQGYRYSKPVSAHELPGVVEKIAQMGAESDFYQNQRAA